MNYTLRGNSEGNIVDIIFENRNILNKDIILNPLKSSVTNPFIYDNMEEGVKEFHNNINNKILILVDSDADGFSSAAEFYIATKKLNKNANLQYIIHDSKKHGLTPYIMDKVLNIKPDILIIPDAGSNDYEQHKILFDNNIKIIVIDHHEADGYSEHAIVINNQLSKLGNKTLSGGGMVLKFFEAYDQIYNTNVSFEILDLAALAMIMDSMLMTEEETRYYCKQGMRNVNNKFMKHFFKNNPSFKETSWTVAPIINSIIRMGDFETRLLLFEGLIENIKPMQIEKRGKGLVDTDTLGYLETMVSRYRSRQRTMVNKTIETSDKIETNLCVICFPKEGFNENLSGLVASKVASIYKKPALVLSKTEILYKGSARIFYNINLRSLLDSFKEVDYATGHEAAFGVGIKHENMDKFIAKCNKFKAPETSDYLVDKIYNNDINTEDIFDVLRFKDEWSKGFEQPIFAVKLNNINIKNIDFYARNTVCLKTYSGKKLLKFSCTEDEIFKLNTMELINITAIVEFELDKYGKYCITIKDWNVEDANEEDFSSWWE